MDNIIDWDSDMDNNNNDLNVDFKHDLSDVQRENEFSTESDHSDKKQNEDCLLNFDSVPQNFENNNVEVSFESNIVFQDSNLFADCSNDDTHDNFENDDCKIETKVNSKDQITLDSNNAFQDSDVFTECFNDDKFGNFKSDYDRSEPLETKVNTKDQITFDEKKLNEDHKNVVPEVDDKKKQQSNIPKTSFEPKTNQTGSGTNCDVCSKTAYPMESVAMDSKLYHKTCFRCCVCQKALTPSCVTKFKNNIFCKPHYIEKFRKRGKYDDIVSDNTNPDSTTSNYNYTPMNQSTNYQPSETKKSVENKEKFVRTKDLTSVFEDSSKKEEEAFERKEPIYIGSVRRVSDAAKAWTENPGGDQNLQRRNSNNNNINDSEINHMSKGSVKNLKKIFEANN